MDTDYDKFLTLYRSVGIEPEEGTTAKEKTLTLTVDHQKKVEGYSGFYTILSFDFAGAFQRQEIYE